MKHTLNILLATAALSAFTVCRTTAAMRPDPQLATSAGASPVVQIIVTHLSVNPTMPWQKFAPNTRVGYGVLVAPNRILTAEHLVRNNAMIEVSHPRSAQQFPARVVVSDYEVNLALLESDQGFADNAAVLPVSSLVTPGDDVELLQIDETMDVQVGSAAVLRTRMAPLPSAAGSVLTTDLLTEMSIDGEGAPVLRAGKLAGVIISYSPRKRIAQMLCSPTLSRFLEDATTPPYNGIASAGFTWKPLIDGTKRRYLKVPGGDNGILILSCMPGTPAARVLKPNDVVVRWDQHAIDAMGFYEDPELGRLSFTYLVAGRGRAGDEVPVDIVRDGVTQTVALTLGRYSDSDALIPDNVMQEPAEYLVAGGMILRELTGHYLDAHGQRWPSHVGPQITHLYLTRRQSPKKPGDKVVILVGVLPDPVNIGYQHFGNIIVSHVNDRPVHSMKDVFAAVDEADGIETLRLRNIDTPIVLDSQACKEADQRLAQAYRIAELFYRKQEPLPFRSEATDTD